MALGYKDWIDRELEVIEGSAGGDTYLLDGRKYCYAFLRSHARAVRLLSGEHAEQYHEITEEMVAAQVDAGKCRADLADCQLTEYGYLGARVYDGHNEYVGTIGSRCSKDAGWGTDHLGYGRCKYHGGSDIAGRMLAHMVDGHSSIHLRTQIQDKIGKFLNDPAPLDLSKELATQRAMLEMLMEHTVNRGDIDYFTNNVPKLMELLDSIGNMANRAALIEKRYAMTAAQVLYIQNVFIDIINSYIESPRLREKIASELKQRLGTGVREVNLATQSYLVDAGSSR